DYYCSVLDNSLSTVLF
nr:immunoglobulin light chain junction region [Macaca mulatta]